MSAQSLRTMPIKSSLETPTNHEAISGAVTPGSVLVPDHPPVAPVPPAPPNWTAVAAIIISIGTLLKTLWTDWRTWRHAKAADFETHYGSPVRNGLRDFESKLKTLRSFTFASPRSADDMKSEIDPLRAEWEDASIEVANLLGEVDGFNSLYEADWRAAFEENCARAETALENLVSAATTGEQVISGAQIALDAYKCAIVEVRGRLDRQSRANKNMRGRP